MTTQSSNPAIQRLVAESIAAWTESFVLIDPEGSSLYANNAAQRLLAARGGADVSSVLNDDSLRVTRWHFLSDGQTLSALSFCEVERAERHLRQVAAFGRTASHIACRGPLSEVLDRVAAEARDATGARACSIILVDSAEFRIGLVGKAGHGEDYLERLMRCVELGAPLASIAAYQTGQPAERSGLREIMAEDARYEPLEPLIREFGWEHVVAVPAVIQGRCVGVLTSFFGPGQQPTDDDITFLLALADQTAAAVDNANLIAKLQESAASEQRHQLAIDLHDSVSQSLFSVIAQCRALGMRVRAMEPTGGLALVEATTNLEATALEMQREVRNILRQMQPNVHPPSNLRQTLETLRRQLDDLTIAGSPRVELELPEQALPPLGGVTQGEVLRVIREAATNSLRHARANVVRIGIALRESELCFYVADDGIGLSRTTPSPGHLGLESMERRAHQLGGSLNIDASPSGTVVRLTLPYTNG